MENVELGLLPSIIFEEEINFFHQSPSKELIAIGAGNVLYIYNKKW